MSARQDVDDLLGRWRQLTEAEAGAIQSAAWPDVGSIQSAKTVLQGSLDTALAQWTLENGLGSVPPDHPFREEVNRLLSLETRNAELLAAQFQRVERERISRAEALRNLHRLRRSYGPKRRNGWESYS
jgi:hypothetical protein